MTLDVNIDSLQNRRDVNTVPRAPSTNDSEYRGREINTVEDVETKGDIFRLLNKNLPLNEYNLPDYIYRSDLIPADLHRSHYTLDDRSKILHSATLPLSFDHGYPAINSTTPLWERLPSESEEAYNAYLIYLELPEKSNFDNPIRLLPLIAQVTKIDVQRIEDFSDCFYWHWRSRAYDLFLAAAHRMQRERRIMSIEGYHFKMAEEQLEKVRRFTSAKLDHVMAQFAEEPDADDTKLKDLVDVQEKLVKIQRVSLGLPANGISQFEGLHHNTVDDELRNVSKESTNAKRTSRRPEEMDRILSSPDDLASIQDLLVRTYAPDDYAKMLSSPDSDSDTDFESGGDSIVEDLGNPNPNSDPES